MVIDVQVLRDRLDRPATMTMKRWKKIGGSRSGSWILYSEKLGAPDRHIPFTKYSNLFSNGFRCVLNHSDDQLRK